MPETSFSLLERLFTQPDADSWNRLAEVYTPVLQAWLRRYQVFSPADVDDLVQDVLLAVSQDLPRFQHKHERGAFRGWLRAILVNRVRYFWRSRQQRPRAVGGSDFLQQLEQLEDAASEMSRSWDREHDRQVMQRLLDLIEPRFAPATWQAFRRQALDGVPAEEVAIELAMPLHSVYASKSRVLKALRTLADGLID
jgi:RNA polymerase sigma factor (sigma-70 family)